MVKGEAVVTRSAGKCCFAFDAAVEHLPSRLVLLPHAGGQELLSSVKDDDDDCPER